MLAGSQSRRPDISSDRGSGGQPDTTRPVSQLDLIGQHILRFSIQPVGIAIDNLNIAGILPVADDLADESPNSGFDELGAGAVSFAIFVDRLDELVRQRDRSFDFHTATILCLGYRVNARWMLRQRQGQLRKAVEGGHQPPRAAGEAVAWSTGFDRADPG